MTGPVKKRAIFLLEIVFPVCLADEIKDGEEFFSFAGSQASSKLLQKDRKGSGGAKEEDGVDRRDIDTFVVQIDHENASDFSGFQFAFCGISFFVA